jgi:hypothetical protein
MSQQTVSLELPDELYRRIHDIANASDQTIEAVLRDLLLNPGLLLENLDATLAQMQNYSDAQLWAVVYHRLSPTQDDRFRELLDLGHQGKLTDEQSAELDELVELTDKLNVLRVEAFVLLKGRGYDINKYREAGL